MRTNRIVDFALPVDHRGKTKENERRDKYFDLARELKVMEHESDGNANYNWCARNGPQRFGKGTGRVENLRTSRDHPNYSIIKIGQNTEKSPGDLSSLAVTCTLVKDHQLILV